MLIDTKDFSEYRICLVQDCNLRCKYCSTGFGRWGKKPLIMDKTMIKRVVNFILKNSSSSFKITFSGGETLTAFTELKYFVDLLISLKGTKKVMFAVATNGTTISERIADYIIQNKITLTFSLDGDKQTTDRNRIFSLMRKNNSVYDSAVNGLEMIKKAVKKAGITKYLYSAECSLDQNANIFNSVQHLFDLGFNDVLARPVQSSSFTHFSEGDSITNYLEFLNKTTSEILGDLDIADLVVGNYEYMLVNVRETIVQSLNKKHELCCNAIKESICINADGTFVPCFMFNCFSDKYIIGDIINGLDLDKAINTLSLLKSKMEVCKSCSCGNICHKCYLSFIDDTDLKSTPESCSITIESKRIILDTASQILNQKLGAI
jgi:uncharacterized protein